MSALSFLRVSVNKLRKMISMKFYLRTAHLLLLIVSIALLFILGGTALIFNQKLLKNQNYFLQVNEIESSRILMSNSLAGFLARQENILGLRNLNELHNLPPRKSYEVQFSQGLAGLAAITKDNPEIIKELQLLNKQYKEFLVIDDKLLTTTHKILTIKEQLRKLASTIDEDVKILKSQSGNINGLLTLKNIKEDNPLNLDMLSRRLERKGFQVITAIDGQQGIDKATSDQPDLILMDMSLPIIDGWTATTKIKADPNTHKIPIIALTAHTMVGDQEKAEKAGCDDYDTKPIDFARLLGKIAKFIKITE